MSNPEFPQNPVPSYNPPPDPGKNKNTNIILFVLLGGCGCMGVMVIILAAILFPVFAQARSKARTVSCMSNEKQMALAVLMYAQDNDERYPISTEWMIKTQPYTKNEMLYQCPAAPGANPARLTVYSYAYNSKMSGRSIAELSSPALAALIYDSSTLTENASDPLTSLPVPPRHDSFNVLSFADGHSKAFTAEAFQALLEAQPKSLNFSQSSKSD